MRPATINATLDLCTKYPFRQDGQRQCGIQSLHDPLHMTSTGNRTLDLLILSPMPYPFGLNSIYFETIEKQYKYYTNLSCQIHPIHLVMCFYTVELSLVQ